jgi:hypothetical protein
MPGTKNPTALGIWLCALAIARSSHAEATVSDGCEGAWCPTGGLPGAVRLSPVPCSGDFVLAFSANRAGYTIVLDIVGNSSSVRVSYMKPCVSVYGEGGSPDAWEDKREPHGSSLHFAMPPRGNASLRINLGPFKKKPLVLVGCTGGSVYASSRLVYNPNSDPTPMAPPMQQNGSLIRRSRIQRAMVCARVRKDGLVLWGSILMSLAVVLAVATCRLMSYNSPGCVVCYAGLLAFLLTVATFATGCIVLSMTATAQGYYDQKNRMLVTEPWNAVSYGRPTVRA